MPPTSRALLPIVATIFLACPRPTVAPRTQPAPIDRDVLAELNRVRSDPAAYAAELERLVPFYSGRVLRLPGRDALSTREGAAALEEAVLALRQASAGRTLLLEDGLCRAARDHARDLGLTGARSHESSDGADLAARIGRYGRVGERAGEAIAFGSSDAATIVRQLIVDDGVPDRGHRKTLLDPRFRQAGVATAPHRIDRVVCVIDLATSFRPGSAH